MKNNYNNYEKIINATRTEINYVIYVISLLKEIKNNFKDNSKKIEENIKLYNNKDNILLSKLQNYLNNTNDIKINLHLSLQEVNTIKYYLKFYINCIYDLDPSLEVVDHNLLNNIKRFLNMIHIVNYTKIKKPKTKLRNFLTSLFV